MILELLKSTLAPASITTIVALLGVSAILSFARPRAARVWTALVFLLYWTLATPIGAGLLARTIDSGFGPLERAKDAQGATAVVLLGGGTRDVQAAGGQVSSMSLPSTLRALETARLYRLLGGPLVVVSGGPTARVPGAVAESEVYRTALAALGVPADRIVGESESQNTHDEAVLLKRMFAERHIEHFVLVTSPLHLRRSLATFAAQGLFPVASPAPLYPARAGAPWPFVPNDLSLEVGAAVLYEWAATIYYRARRWT